MDELQAGLEQSWASTCRILFGTELGPLLDYHGWLAELVDPVTIRRSSLTGREVIYSTPDYSKKAKCVGLDEIDLNKKFPPLGINQLKDIDSIVQAIQDRVYYAGNIVLGNSKHVLSSSNITDCFYILHTTLSSNSKNMAFCTQCMQDDGGFGGNAFSESSYCLKCHEGTRLKRDFELWMSQDSSDCYYSQGLKNCSNCLFSFNLQNKRNAVGNLELPLDQYNKIKTKLMAELVEEARRNKRLPSLLELVGKSAKSAPALKPPALANFHPRPAPVLDKSKIEAAFSQTMSLLFGHAPSRPIDAYSSWLLAHTRGLDKCRSALSGQDVFLAHYGNYSDLPRDRLLTLEEAQAFGQQVKWAPADLSNLSLSTVPARLSPLAFFNTDIVDGQNPNDIECAVCIDASNCYRTVCSAYSKLCAYSFWPQWSEQIFGSDIVFYSSFCVNCYQSSHLRRCFEMDSCNSCSDSLFCHHCENLTDCMFCFNVKNLRYAIGNVAMGPEEYKRVKKMVLAQLSGQLEKNQSLNYDIFSL